METARLLHGGQRPALVGVAPVAADASAVPGNP